jgi:hypothetical protein
MPDPAADPDLELVGMGCSKLRAALRMRPLFELALAICEALDPEEPATATSPSGFLPA